MYYIHGNYLCNGVNISWNKRCWHWQVTHSSVTMRHILLHLVAWLTHKCKNVPVKITRSPICLSVYTELLLLMAFEAHLFCRVNIFLMVLVSVSIKSAHQTHFFWIIVKNFFQYFSEKINVERKKSLWVESIARKVARPLRFLPEAGLGGRFLQ